MQLALNYTPTILTPALVITTANASSNSSTAEYRNQQLARFIGEQLKLSLPVLCVESAPVDALSLCVTKCRIERICMMLIMLLWGMSSSSSKHKLDAWLCNVARQWRLLLQTAASISLLVTAQ